MWSRDADTGEEGYKPVVRLFVHDADTLVDLTYTSGSCSETITGTPTHPFWSVTRDTWVGMGRLHTGEKLKLAGGDTATVTAVTIEHPTHPTKVYNFEVADWHTYHVGSTDTNWVWVHNLCKVGKRMARSLIRRGVDARDAIRLVKSGKLKGPGVYQFTARGGKTYVGQSANMFRRIKQHLKPGGRLLPKDINSIQTFRPQFQGWRHRKILEQTLINQRGGVAKLANKYNAIHRRFWDSLGIPHP